MILPHKLGTTNDLLTSQAGLLVPAQLMDSLDLASCIDHHLPAPGNHRGYAASTYIQTLLLMQHAGGFHLDDVRQLKADKALRSVLRLPAVPSAVALGNWLRRMGQLPDIQARVAEVNRYLLSVALHRCREVTLDIDASEIVAQKAETKWTYKKNRGYMPMVGHIAETDQVVAVDFREGNVAPAKDNLAFLKQCEAALPAGVRVKAFRGDAAAYQEKIIRHCDSEQVVYAIRATLSPGLKAQIAALPATVWQPMLDREGKTTGQQTYRTSHCIGGYDKAFTLVIQRQPKQGQAALAWDETSHSEEYETGGFVYRAIATNQDSLSDSDVAHWYNDRGEASENRIKELKNDFGGATLPCSNFQANALYFALTALAYNLFALLRGLLPKPYQTQRAPTLRWRLYQLAAKVVKTGRQVIVKLHTDQQKLLAMVLARMRDLPVVPAAL